MKKTQLTFLLVVLVMFNGYCQDFEVFKEGVGGNTSGQMLSRINSSVLSHNPTTTIVLAGTNDFLNLPKLASMEEYESNLREIVDRVLDNGSGIVLMTIPAIIESIWIEDKTDEVIASYEPEGQNGRLVLANEIVSQIASEKGLVLIDTYTLFENNMNLLSNDGVHPTTAGARAITDLLYDAIEENRLPIDSLVLFGDSITNRYVDLLEEKLTNEPIQFEDGFVALGENIQDAIDSANASGGGTVTLAAGTHTITETLEMKSNVTFQGSGIYASTIKINENKQIMAEDGYSSNRTNTVNNVLIQNITFIGVNGDEGGVAITQQNTDNENITFLNVRCYNVGWGVHIKGAKNVLIENCDFSRNGAVGKEGFAHNLYLRRVYGAVVKNSSFNYSISANGINISYSEDVEIYDCEMIGNDFRGVRAADSDGYLVHDCVITDNGNVGLLANTEVVVTKNIDWANNCVANNDVGMETKNGATGTIKNCNSYGNGSNYKLVSSVSQSNNISNSNQECGSTQVITCTSFISNINPPSNLVSGVAYNYYEGTWDALPNFDSLTPQISGITSEINLSATTTSADYFGYAFEGYINMSSEGEYTFYTTSDDGSGLWIDGNLVVNNDGLHGAVEKSGTICLESGYHKINVAYFEKTGGNTLSLAYAGPGISKTGITNIYTQGEATTSTFTPDPNKTYYIDSAHFTNSRIAATGDSEEPYITSTSTTGDNVEWKFVDKGNGYWHIQLASGGAKPRLRSNNSSAADMQATSSSGDWTHYEITEGYIDNSYFLTLPDGPTEFKRLQINNSKKINMVSTASNRTWESFKITEAGTTIIAGDVRLEAEDNDRMSGIQTESTTDTNGGENVGWINNGDWLRFDDVNLSGLSNMDARIACNFTGGIIEVRTGSETGTLIGSISITNTGGNQEWDTFNTSISGVNGIQDVYLVFTGGTGYLFNVNWIEFNNSSKANKGVIASAEVNDVVIYPNPVIETTTIVNAENSIMNIYDMNGSLVLSQSISSEIEILDLSLLATSIYYAEVVNEGQSTVIKLIKK